MDSPAPAPQCRTLLSLPPEILVSCLLLPSPQYGYDLKPPLPPKNVLLVCRRLYAIAAPCLYAHLWVEPHATGLGQSPLVPLLAATQRPAFSLPPWQRMADPAWVRGLTILPSEPHASHDPLLCRVLALVLPAMSLRSLRWEGRQISDEGVARLVAQQPGLETICCRLGGPLWRTALKGLTEIVAWHDELLPYEHTGGAGLLHGSADTLETLHLAVGYPFDAVADVARQIVKGVDAMPQVRALRLTGFSKEAVAAIERVVAFASVQDFQIMRGAGLDALRGKDLSSAHTLAGNATPRGLVELLTGCETRLRHLRVRLVDCAPEDHAPADHPHEPPPPPLPATAIIDALGRHGAALTTLVLAHDSANGRVANDPALLCETDVARLVEHCPCLEELSIRVGLEHVIKISPLLAKLARLSHLVLDIVHDSPIADDLSSSPPYRLPPSTMPLWSVDRHWFYPDGSELDPAPPATVTPLEVVLSHLLAEGPPRLQSVRLDILNINPESPFHHALRNRYEMRPGTPADRRLRAPGDYLYAPPGHRYAWSGGEFVVVSWDRFRAGKRRETFVSSSFWTSAFEGQQMTV